jgi:MOSC domain-containing protein YiiM
MTPHVISIQVGLPRSLGVEGASNRMDRPWSTGFFKEPIQGERWLGITNLAGDRQADLKHHGGVEKAVLAYAATHYPWWQEQLNLPDLPCGAFGENLTVAQQMEQEVCIGDIYEFGGSQIQVSQPRQPCWKLSRRWRIQDLAVQVQRSGRTGWYFRVLREGYVAPDRPLILCDRPYPQWTITRANQIMHHDVNDRDATIALAECPALATNWQRTLLNRATKGVNPDSSPRLWGDI